MIGIIGAMDSEISTLLENMSTKEVFEYNNYKFYKGTLFEKQVVIVKCGIGKINAAICTQILLFKFDVEKVINTGIAGATGEGLNQYDFVVSTEAVYHDVDVQFFGYKLGQIPGLPEKFSADGELIELALNAFKNCELAQGENHKITKGLVASGDQFIAGGERKKFIMKNFAPMCVEMEGCSIAHTCYVNKVPFVIIRCMSDCADENVKTGYSEEIASKLSSTFLLEVVKSL